MRRAKQAVVLALTATLMVVASADVHAKRKKVDNKTLEMAVELAKDREKYFSGNECMSPEEFQAQWKAFADRMDAEFEGHEVALRQFGADVRHRKGFSHVIYVALRSQTRGIDITPAAQDLVARHPFLQELVLKGSCYTGGDPFPKKMRELLEANPGIPFLLAERLDDWDARHKSEFLKAYPKTD